MAGLLPHLLTGGNLFLGLSALLLAAHGQWADVSWAILAAAVLDGLDGWAARRLRCETAFGKLWDSCADFISFGCAPAVAFTLAHGGESRFTIFLAGFGYLACAGLRLFRFPLQPAQPPGSVRWRRSFVGLPTTASGTLFAAVGLLFPPGREPVAGFHLLVLVGLSAAMVSSIRFPHMGTLRLGTYH